MRIRTLGGQHFEAATVEELVSQLANDAGVQNTERYILDVRHRCCIWNGQPHAWTTSQELFDTLMDLGGIRYEEDE